MKKEEIYVEITNEQERLRAIEILQNAREEIWEDSSATTVIGKYKYLKFTTDGWWIGTSPNDRSKITLDELKALLTPKKSNVFTDVQEWIRDNFPHDEFTIKQDTPECIERLKQHLINDYPKGTEIKISANKIEIYHS